MSEEFAESKGSWGGVPRAVTCTSPGNAVLDMRTPGPPPSQTAPVSAALQGTPAQAHLTTSALEPCASASGTKA